MRARSAPWGCRAAGTAQERQAVKIRPPSFRNPLSINLIKMATYKELLQKREELNAEINSLREKEKGDAVKKVRTIAAEFGLTQSDIFPSAKGFRAAREKVAAKYRDPLTGSTWTGRGKPPNWIKNKDRAQFAIAA